MILLGLILIVVGVGAGTLVWLGTSHQTDTVTIEALGGTVNLPALTLFLAGAAAMLAVWLGWALLRTGFRRSARRRRQAKELQRQAAQDQAERDRATAAEFDRAATRSRAEQEAADEKLRDQRRATETARQRAEVAERRADDTGSSRLSDPSGTRDADRDSTA